MSCHNNCLANSLHIVTRKLGQTSEGSIVVFRQWKDEYMIKITYCLVLIIRNEPLLQLWWYLWPNITFQMSKEFLSVSLAVTLPCFLSFHLLVSCSLVVIISLYVRAVGTPLQWTFKTRYKIKNATVTHLESLATEIEWVCSRVENSTIYKSNHLSINQFVCCLSIHFQTKDISTLKQEKAFSKKERFSNKERSEIRKDILK